VSYPIPAAIGVASLTFSLFCSLRSATRWRVAHATTIQLIPFTPRAGGELIPQARDPDLNGVPDQAEVHTEAAVDEPVLLIRDRQW
jgi:hypothetical protein